jgi:phosphoribosylcarboxyaminoimidazole (NCAIR) mutase
LLAARIMANSESELAARLERCREEQTGSVAEAPE